MSRILQAETQMTVAELLEKARHSPSPLEVRDAGMVVVVFPQRDYARMRAIREFQKVLVTRPRKTRAGYLAETLRTLRRYERKYKMTSAEFYRRFQSGELGEDELDYFDWRVQYNAYRNLKKRGPNGKR